MDWLTFLSSDIKSLAWPIAVLVAIVVMKRDIAALLRALAPRLQKAKGPWGELTFGQGVDEVEDKLPPAETKAITEVEEAKRIEDVSELARLPPSYIVSQAWLRLEHAIREAVDERSGEIAVSAGGGRKSPLIYVEKLSQHDILPSEEVDILHEMRQLRNRAVHSLDPDITITDALRYNDIANSLLLKIEQSRKGQVSP
jgi:uncharacterized protein YutE (UPF0331/DUF86 family)